jgi:hypothetical protein
MDSAETQTTRENIKILALAANVLGPNSVERLAVEGMIAKQCERLVEE